MNEKCEKIYIPEKDIKKAENTINIVEELEEALKTKDVYVAEKILSKKDYLNNIIAQRGEDDRFLNLIEGILDFMLEKEFKNLPKAKNKNEKPDIYNIKSDYIVEYLKKTGIGSDFLVKIMSIAFHKRDNKKFFRVFNIIMENIEILDPKTVNRAMHNLASWEAVKFDQESSDKAIKINENVKEVSNYTGDKNYSLKAKYGIISNLNIKPKKKAEIFLKIKEDFCESENSIDAIQAMNEAAKAYVSLAKNQLNMIPDSKEKQGNVKIMDLADENLELAKKIAKESLIKSIEIKYVNAEIKAREILSDIYFIMDDNKKSRSFKKKSDDLRKKFNYKTTK